MFNKQKFAHKKRGVTLIELLVVISIIALLSSVIMVVVQSAITKSKVAKVKADMIQIRNAAEVYKTDTGNYPPVFGYTDWLIPKYIPREPISPFGGRYDIIIETSNSYYCGQIFSNQELEKGRLAVYLRNAVNVPASGFNKFYAMPVGFFYNGGAVSPPLHGTTPVQPCID